MGYCLVNLLVTLTWLPLMLTCIKVLIGHVALTCLLINDVPLGWTLGLNNEQYRLRKFGYFGAV